MHLTYILFSPSLDKYYIGETQNLEEICKEDCLFKQDLEGFTLNLEGQTFQVSLQGYNKSSFDLQTEDFWPNRSSNLAYTLYQTKICTQTEGYGGKTGSTPIQTF